MRTLPSLLVTAVACSVASGQLSPHQAMPPRPKAPLQRGAAPDLILYRGRIYTGNGLNEGAPETVSALAIREGIVMRTGSDEAVKRLAGPRTRLVDLDSVHTGAVVFPGFNDAHTHLGDGGRTRLNVDLTGTKSLSEMLEKVRGFAKAAPQGHWLTGGNWDHTLWAKKVLPTRQDLDKVTGEHPAFLGRIDGHIAVANSAALAAAGITASTKPPQGGAIDLDAQGQPTGILRESAQGLVEKVIPPPSRDERMRGDLLAIQDALAHGLTSVQDFSEWDDFLVFEELEKQGRLKLRISEWLPFKAPLEKLKEMRAHHPADDPLLHTGMLKGFMDGSLGSRTAALKEPYADEPGNRGLPQYTQGELDRMAAERAKEGFQLGFHAIGDEATAMALDAFGQPGVSTTARNRIEHAQVVDPEDVARFKRLGVIASMQPNHLLTDMNWAEERLGERRAAYSYAWKAFLDAGVPLAFGTDYPVEPITPFRGLYAAVTRKNEAGTKTYFPENRLTRGQALYAYTQGSAYAEFAEKRKGRLAPGYEADFVVLDRDLIKAPEGEILKTQVRQTWVGGKLAYVATPGGDRISH